MSELRDKIADQVLMHYEYRGDINYVAAENRDSENYLYCQDAADAVLAVLADPPESVIERAARELDPAAYNDLNATSIPRRRAAEAWMRKAFRAAFGINNYKEKRK